MNQSVRDLIDRAAASRSEAIYAIAADSDISLSYTALLESCRRIFAFLQSRGVHPGETVSVVMPNGLNTLRILLGAMWAGYCVNPVNLLSQSDQMRYVLEHSDCRIVFVGPEWEERVRSLLVDISRAVEIVVVHPEVDEIPGGLSEDLPPRPAPESLALLMYTSGTTGRPKGVMLSQANLASNATSIEREHRLTTEDRVLGVLPLYHINAFAVTMLAPLASGGSVAMAPKFSAARFWEQVRSKSCTWINVVPTMISYLLEASAPDLHSLAAVRFCRSASASLPPEHLRAFEEKFGIGVIETMGLTETVAPSFSNPIDPFTRKLGSVGRASGCEARVIDTMLQPVSDGTTGEVAIRGPNVMLGYYKDPDATTNAFAPGGWLRTGDLGYRDSDGFFFITGRIKELIIKGGENIAPREIDEALLQHPDVLDGAAVGVPDRHYGQEILACVVLREGAHCSEEALRDFCIEKLGRYKAPKFIRIVPDLPRGPSGKVQRLKLADLLTVT